MTSMSWVRRVKRMELSFCLRPLLGAEAGEASVGDRIHNHAQGAVVIIRQRNEAEWLEDSIGCA